MGGIVWLASYPKSGNTWMRAFLTSLLGREDEDFDINGLMATIASSRFLLDNWIGTETSDLDAEEIDLLLPEAYAALAASVSRPYLLKVHDAWRRNARGEPVFPARATLAALYIVRNPLDVAVSMGYFFGYGATEASRRLADPAMSLCRKPDRLAPQISQTLGDWSSHVRSWVDDSGLDVLVVRYEDMLARPEAVFTQAATAATVAAEPDAVRRAIEETAFSRLARLEEANGFREHSMHSPRFFRSGRSGDWRRELEPAVAARIARDHAVMMRRFGYGDDLEEALTLNPSEAGS